MGETNQVTALTDDADDATHTSAIFEYLYTAALENPSPVSYPTQTLDI